MKIEFFNNGNLTVVNFKTEECFQEVKEELIHIISGKSNRFLHQKFDNKEVYLTADYIRKSKVTIIK